MRRGTLALLWTAALALTAVVRLQQKQLQHTADQVSFLENASDAARAHPNSNETDPLLRLAQQPGAVEIQRALLDSRLQRLKLTGGALILIYGALLLTTWRRLGRRYREPS